MPAEENKVAPYQTEQHDPEDLVAVLRLISLFQLFFFVLMLEHHQSYTCAVFSDYLGKAVSGYTLQSTTRAECLNVLQQPSCNENAPENLSAWQLSLV
ncbi:hypothetical protein P6910_23080 [Endozoicomonas sp. 8E]|nr:hypothetical protein [Endozoicomonas sp. 8E]WOG27400.1 hypothetical protein P6910_23080 [Endozoicomonas sp. 8E]